MSHGWIILLTLVAQAEAAPASGLNQPQTIYTSPQLQPLPPSPAASAMGDEIRLLSAEEGRAIGNRNQPLPLAPRGVGANNHVGVERSAPTPGSSIVTVVSSLAIVLGLLFGVTWLMRRAAPAGSQLLPSDVVQVLGRAMLSPRQPMQLVRIGDKLVLIASTPGGVQTLTEITDRAEVERLAAACEAARGGSATGTFRQVLSQLGNEPVAGGFFGRDEAVAPAANANASRNRQQRRSSAEVRHA
jgi:flagellar protein FliO/FliZ